MRNKIEQIRQYFINDIKSKEFNNEDIKLCKISEYKYMGNIGLLDELGFRLNSIQESLNGYFGQFIAYDADHVKALKSEYLKLCAISKIPQ